MTTTSAYLSVIKNLERYQNMTAAKPDVKTAAGYYAANIGKVASIKDFVGNYRLLSFALTAHGLGDHIANKALVTKVLQGGVSDSQSLANTLPDPRWKAFAKAFDFVGKGAASVSTPDAISGAKSRYVESQLEKDQGASNVGVQLALYFKRVAPTISGPYGILGDKNLLAVVQTIFNLPPNAGTNIDAQASVIGKLVPASDFQDPKKLQQLTARFTAMYDVAYGPNSNSGRSLSVASNGGPTTVSAASTILGGVISSNGLAIATLSRDAPISFSSALLTSLQGLRLGG